MANFSELVYSSRLPVSVQEAFAYHARRGTLDRLIPPWETVQIESSDQSLEVGSRVILRTSIAGIPIRWVAEHTAYDPPLLFADTQVSGPFASWNHRHEFQSADEQTILTDRIRLQLPMGAVGRTLGIGMAQRKVDSMFSYRHRVTQDDLELKKRLSSDPMRVAISGSSGLVGSSLSTLLSVLGHQVNRIVRSKAKDDSEIAAWSGQQEVDKWNDIDAVVHLAGKSIADARWTEKVKQGIRSSRVDKTRLLCESLAKLPKKPKVLVCASATGIYGDRGDEILHEGSRSGDDFLADVASQWEEACRPAREAGIRVVHARFGIVLSPRGGALRKMLLPAKFALGGRLGGGNQWWSWIALDDVIGAILHVIANESISGPVNFVAPESITNSNFAGTLGRVLGRPLQVPAPAFALRLSLGEMADSLLLASTRVRPDRLVQSGYRFRFSDLAECLRYSVGRL